MLPVRDSHPLWSAFPGRLRSHSSQSCRSYNPAHAVTCTVWAPPFSLATTCGITVVFSSCGYLDVSVPHVRLPYRDTHIAMGGLPHSDIHGSIPLAGPRGFSQLGTSFFASESLGIPRAPLFTYSLHPSPFCLRMCAVSVRPPLRSGTHSVAFSAQHVNELMAPFGDICRNTVRNGILLIRPSRKEVFQPHLPVRLPCYDLAPVTGSTLNGSLRLPPSGLPDFHGLTGGVYKVRERIHRAMADARLLAIPASWGRVADPNPN